jgi:hypothetical protein
MSLYISMNFPGKALSNSPIDTAVTALASKIALENRNGCLPETPVLDLTFMLPGKDEKPDFSGMRMGGYTRDNRTLYFETAVPEHIPHSNHAPDYVARVLDDVLVNAEIYFSETGIEFNAALWRSALDKFIKPINMVT